MQLKGWRSSFWLLAAIHLTIFFAHLLFGLETLYPNRSPPGKEYDQNEEVTERTSLRQFLGIRIYNRRQIHRREFCRPLGMVVRPVVLLPALAYSITFAYTNVLMVRVFKSLSKFLSGLEVFLDCLCPAGNADVADPQDNSSTQQSHLDLWRDIPHHSRTSWSPIHCTPHRWHSW